MTDISAGDFAETIASALQREVGDSRSAAKKVARAAGGSVRQAQAWLAGHAVPGGYALALLMREFRIVRDAVLGRPDETGEIRLDAELAELRARLERLERDRRNDLAHADDAVGAPAPRRLARAEGREMAAPVVAVDEAP